MHSAFDALELIFDLDWLLIVYLGRQTLAFIWLVQIDECSHALFVSSHSTRWFLLGFSLGPHLLIIRE